MNIFFNVTKITFFIVFFNFNFNCQAQAVDSISVNQKETEDKKTQSTVQTLPEFPGGMMGFAAYVSKNYKVPATFSGSGTIYVSFIVEKDGSLSDIKVLRDLGYGTGEEAVRIIKATPKWKPGMQDGTPVRVAYNLPIKLNKK
ncbi:energy transducer TonB [Flavobacterium qiangtangense]|uniref:Energy transducer TonB n=1 Tax=Flavobacterium qiangtangense TaxID=1442595 RepID=A0ABW1PQA1_9FLAO